MLSPVKVMQRRLLPCLCALSLCGLGMIASPGCDTAPPSSGAPAKAAESPRPIELPPKETATRPQAVQPQRALDKRADDAMAPAATGSAVPGNIGGVPKPEPEPEGTTTDGKLGRASSDRTDKSKGKLEAVMLDE